MAELQTLVAAAVQRPRDVARLRLHLAEHGVDVQVPVVMSREVPQADVVAVTAVSDGDAERERRTRWTLIVASLAVFGVLYLVYLGAPERQHTPTILPSYPHVYPGSTDYLPIFPGSTDYPPTTPGRPIPYLPFPRSPRRSSCSRLT